MKDTHEMMIDLGEENARLKRKFISLKNGTFKDLPDDMEEAMK